LESLYNKIRAEINSPKIEEGNKALTLNQLVRSHAHFKTIKDYHKRADEMHSMALKYKRSFGKEEREQRKLLFRESKDLRSLAKQEEKYLISTFLDEADVIACTLVGSYDIHLKGRRFQTVIIDEAGQALEPATWIPILKADKVIFAGDPLQLPPTVKSARAEKLGLETTLIEKCIERQGNAVQLLNTQYRMNENIMKFSSDQFYGGNLLAADAIAKAKLEGQEVIEWIDTAGCGYEEEGEGKSRSRTNPGETEILKKHLSQLMDIFGDDLEVGVISPYRAQVELLRETLVPQKNLIVQTIDGFQGQEKDVIYISLVRSNEAGNIGFLKDRRRMNVAMTRAKKKLIIIGDSATIGNDSFYNAFLDYIESINAYHSAWEWM
ncbi:MAG: AAA domain-containing protein, partial [Flavobacteriales bacterium]